VRHRHSHHLRSETTYDNDNIRLVFTFLLLAVLVSLVSFSWVVARARQIILLEQERYVPSLALAMKIARVFDMPVDEVFKLAEDA